MYGSQHTAEMLWIEDCPAADREKVALDRIAMSAAFSQTIADTSGSKRYFNKHHALILLSCMLLAFIKTHEDITLAPADCFVSYPLLRSPGESVVAWPNLSIPSHCFADDVIPEDGTLRLPLEFTCFPVSVFHHYPSGHGAGACSLLPKLSVPEITRGISRRMAEAFGIFSQLC